MEMEITVIPMEMEHEPPKTKQGSFTRVLGHLVLLVPGLPGARS